MPSLPDVGDCPFRASLFLYRNIPGGEEVWGPDSGDRGIGKAQDRDCRHSRVSERKEPGSPRNCLGAGTPQGHGLFARTLWGSVLSAPPDPLCVQATQCEINTDRASSLVWGTIHSSYCNKTPQASVL